MQAWMPQSGFGDQWLESVRDSRDHLSELVTTALAELNPKWGELNSDDSHNALQPMLDDLALSLLHLEGCEIDSRLPDRMVTEFREKVAG
jgi:hypothetical protein